MAAAAAQGNAEMKSSTGEERAWNSLCVILTNEDRCAEPCAEVRNDINFLFIALIMSQSTARIVPSWILPLDTRKTPS